MQLSRFPEESLIIIQRPTSDDTSVNSITTGYVLWCFPRAIELLIGKSICYSLFMTFVLFCFVNDDPITENTFLV